MLLYAPGRCDVIIVDFNPQKGKEIMKTRHAVALSGIEYNQKSSLAVVCPITSAFKNWPFEVRIPDGYSVKGVVAADQVKSID